MILEIGVAGGWFRTRCHEKLQRKTLFLVDRLL